QEELAVLQAATGRVIVHTPDAARAVALLDGRVESSVDGRLLVRHPDPAELNALLVGEGLRVTEIGPERRSLEETVLAVTSAGSDRVDSAPPPPAAVPAEPPAAPSAAPAVVEDP
ncbi:MAG: type transport system ATP-binding protein, partial [Cryptosporangiaceae bacterium]|nr:type transport system ATP-binding protein [Cryptosporangiaceae bacterium]